MRSILLRIPLLFLAIMFAGWDDSQLSDTLSWMDNTYNPHPNASLAYGHGRTGWYAPDRLQGEVLASGSSEIFTYDGCQMKLHFEDNPAALSSQDIHGSSSYTFNLRDINPQSIKMSTYTHMGGFKCDPSDQHSNQDCDHAEIDFSTHAAEPLIAEESDRVFTKLVGSDHEAKGTQKGNEAFFEVDEIDYAKRFMKAFHHAVELCGGKPDPF